MKAYPSVEDGEVIIKIRAEGDGSLVGDYTGSVSQGEEFAGLTYDVWLDAAQRGAPVTLTPDT